MQVDSKPPENEEPSKPITKPDTTNHEEPSSDNSVTLNDDGEEYDGGEIKVTDGDGNTI